MTMLPDFSEGSFWSGLDGDGERGLVGVFRVVREGLGEIAVCILEPLLPTDISIDRK